MGLLKVNNLVVHFIAHKKQVKALDGVDLILKKGSTTALAGESGCGKTTLAKAILGFNQVKSGNIIFKDKDITLSKNELIIRKNIQIVFQNPYLSVDVRYTVYKILLEAISVFNKVKKSQADELIKKALADVELDVDIISRYPHQLSGGQLQRVCIARALIVNPEVVILDEPTSSLDITTASKILVLLKKLQQEKGLTYLFISHNLKLLKKISHFCYIMYYGRIVEYGPKDRIYSNPVHPYTKMLMAAANQRLKEVRKIRSFSSKKPNFTEVELDHFVTDF